MTLNWLTQVSFDPPLLAAAVENDAHSLKLVREGGVFTVNIPAREDGKALLEIFVRPQRRVGDKLGGVAFRTAVTGAPILEAATGYLECRVRELIRTGDHTLVVGEVVEAGLISDRAPITMADTGWHYAG